MSRSPRAQCSRGRGCGVCGDTGAVRRKLDAEVGAADLLDGLDEAEERYFYDVGECDGRDCWLCGDESWRTETLPAGVTLVEDP